MSTPFSGVVEQCSASDDAERRLSASRYEILTRSSPLEGVGVSLLDAGTETVTVYPEEEYTDEDGTIRTRPSATGIQALARIEPANQSGTSARRAEQANVGFETEEVYSLKFPRSFPHVLGLRSQVEWRGQRWVIFGFPVYRTRSRSTAHLSYTIKRY